MNIGVVCPIAISHLVIFRPPKLTGDVPFDTINLRSRLIQPLRPLGYPPRGVPRQPNRQPTPKGSSFGGVRRAPSPCPPSVGYRPKHAPRGAEGSHLPPVAQVRRYCIDPTRAGLKSAGASCT